MRAKTVGFAIADQDRQLLDELVNEFGNGNRSEFLRVAMNRMARERFANRLVAIQAEAREQLGGRVLSESEVTDFLAEIKTDLVK